MSNQVAGFQNKRDIRCLLLGHLPVQGTKFRVLWKIWYITIKIKFHIKYILPTFSYFYKVLRISVIWLVCFLNSWFYTPSWNTNKDKHVYRMTKKISDDNTNRILNIWKKLSICFPFPYFQHKNNVLIDFKLIWDCTCKLLSLSI